ncbi:hypothetical protein KSP39_PZI004725 [Platanthera zijinensis]|uniref:Vacuolar ATPase assembly integral membrane protein VMA21 homolog n=1 Tax=Platanthera zijinensis TaxID=2320716 RepID=A0AAP0BZ17_9ASPA
MAGVMQKFLCASMVMWIAPVIILYVFHHRIFPGSTKLSSSSMTLVSGFLAVISVNLVIILYIILAMKEPTNPEHHPDPSFLAAATASINQPISSGSNNGDALIREKTD